MAVIAFAWAPSCKPPAWGWDSGGEAAGLARGEQRHQGGGEETAGRSKEDGPLAQIPPRDRSAGEGASPVEGLDTRPPAQLHPCVRSAGRARAATETCRTVTNLNISTLSHGGNPAN